MSHSDKDLIRTLAEIHFLNAEVNAGKDLTTCSKLLNDIDYGERSLALYKSPDHVPVFSSQEEKLYSITHFQDNVLREHTLQPVYIPLKPSIKSLLDCQICFWFSVVNPSPEIRRSEFE